MEDEIFFFIMSLQKVFSFSVIVRIYLSFGHLVESRIICDYYYVIL